MLVLVKLILLFDYFVLIICTDFEAIYTKVREMKNFVVWPNATVPFYIEPDHFDHEQSLAIMRALSTFAYKTCLKFAPVMSRPQEDQHVMMFINPNGIKRCYIDTVGHSVLVPHMVHVGYECLKSPQIEMMIMRALGFNFEHNKNGRKQFISIILPNIDAGARKLFVEDRPLPPMLQALPYDINSVMHFGEREYTKNGYRTIKFKPTKGDPIKQNRIGLTETDLKKIDLVYGPECLKRDRQEKIEICQSYPGIVRRKRNSELVTLKSLRVNPNITPPSIEKTEDGDQESAVSKNLKELGVEEEAQDVLEQVYKVSAKALKNARQKYCNNTEEYKSLTFNKREKRNSTDVIGILEYITDYVDSMVSNALSNLTIFCQNPDSVIAYQRNCNWRFDNRCVPTYKSTKNGPLFYTTQHRPYIVQSTWHKGQARVYAYDRPSFRSKNDSEEITSTTKQIRRKREAFDSDVEDRDRDTKIKSNVWKRDRKRRYFGRRQYGAVNQASSSGHDSSVQTSDEVHGRALTLESEVIKEPPSLAMKSAKVGIGNGRETKFFGAASKETVDKEKMINDLEKEEIDNVSVQQEKSHNVKNLMNEKDNMKHKLEIKQIRNKKKTGSAEKSSGEDQKRAGQIAAPRTVALSKPNREFYTERMWPEGILRYVITPIEGYDLEDMRSRLSEVNEILKKKTCVRVEEVSEEEAKNHEDYLVLDTSPDYITGRVGGRQHFGCLELFKGGQHRQHAAMMIMAMLGFYFEVARHDRDKYIRVHMRHIRPDKLHHFEKIRDEATLNLPYDFNSATHPAWQFWRKIGKTGISSVATFKTLDPDGSIMRTLGQHQKLLSDLDIVKINSIYGVECFTEPADIKTTGIK